MDINRLNFLNKRIEMPKFNTSGVTTSFNTNFNFNKDFTEKSTFEDNSKQTINSTKQFSKTFHTHSDFKTDINSDVMTSQLNLPNMKMKDFNPQYKYRYPQLSDKEYMIQQWQTHEKTPNELNQYIRSQDYDINLEDIKNGDEVYQQGLIKLKERNKQKQQNLRNDIDQLYKDLNHPAYEHNGDIEDDIMDKEENLERVKKSYDKKMRRQDRNNPLTIRPVFTNSPIKEKIKTNFSNIYNIVKNLDKNITEKIKNKKAVKGTMDNMLNKLEENEKNEKNKKAVKGTMDNMLNKLEENEKNEKNKKEVKGTINNMLNKLEENEKNEKNKKDAPVTTPAKPISTLITLKPTDLPPPKAPAKPDDAKEIDDDDDKTVNNDTFNVPENLKSSYYTGHSILDMYKTKPGSFNLYNEDKTFYNEINKALDKILNKKTNSSDVRTLKSLREKFHYNQPIVYTKPIKAPKKK